MDTNLKFSPTFRYDKLQKHLGLAEKPSTTKKDEKLAYRLFKEGYIKNTQVKPNIPNSEHGKSFILKATVHAAMKKLNYTVYVHLNQETGDIIHGHCSCKAGKGGQCKHVAAMLYQIIDYVQLELLEVPLSLTCTQVQSKCTFVSLLKFFLECFVLSFRLSISFCNCISFVIGVYT